MNDPLTIEALKSLLGPGEGLRVSLFLPTHAAAPDNRADALQLKGLLREAQAQLEMRGMRLAEARALLAPARALADDGLFWRPRPGGLAVFLTPEGIRTYRTATVLEPAVFVDTRVHVRPVIAAADRGERFYVLALSQHLVRLYRGDRESLTEIDLGDMPRDIAEALRNDGWTEQLQSHSSGSAPVGGGRGAAMFHGSGADTGVGTRYLVEYVKRIAGGLRDLLEDRRSPLVIAAVAELAALYRDADREHAVAAGIVAGNPEALAASDLHAKARAMAAAEFDARRTEAIGRFREATGAPRAAIGAGAVLPAAAAGRVDTLLLDAASPLWGRFDPETGAADTHPSREPGDEDLADLAVAATIANGGAVFAVPELEHDLVAVLRY